MLSRWTTQREDLVKEKIAFNWSFLEIANLLNKTLEKNESKFTRNAVAGKVWRLNLSLPNNQRRIKTRYRFQTKSKKSRGPLY